jgi:hypothetical protein
LYVENWNDIKFPLLNCLNNSFEKGKFSVSQRQGSTAVIDNKILNNEIDKLEKELEQIYEQKARRLDLGRNG